MTGLAHKRRGGGEAPGRRPASGVAGRTPARLGRLLGHLAGCLPVLLALAGCAATDTYHRPGTWHPDAANAANIAAMAARPEDLLRGRGSPGSDGALAVQALVRFRDATNSVPGGGQTQGGQASGGQTAGGPSAFAAPARPASGASGSN